MTIRSAESSGTEMRRFLLICLLLVSLLLAGCSSRFSVTESGYTDTKTGRHYVALSAAYEAASGGEEVGTFEDETYGRVVHFRVIPGADAARFLTDEYGSVYCADEQLPDAAAWSVKRILICEEDAITVELSRVTDTADIAQICAVWFEGEERELPLDAASTVRHLKLVSDAFPGVYYGFRFYLYEDGNAYFYSTVDRRAVTVPAELIELFVAEATE